MKNKIKTALVISAFIFLSLINYRLAAQPPRPPQRPPSGYVPIGGNAPVGDDIGIFILLGSLYSTFKYFKFRTGE